jgi:hypothetical protein
MYTVTNDFKDSVKEINRRLRATVTDGSDPITEANDLISVEIITEGSLCRTVMRQANIKYFAESHDYLDDYLNIQIGVVLPDTSTEYIDYGDFKVVEVSEVMAGGIVTLKAYDRMYEAMQKFDITPSYPVTTFELVQAICTELDWTLGATEFVNDDISITEDLFKVDQMTYRGVLDMIAEASGSIVYFNEDDELDFKQISDVVEETLDVTELITLNLETEYGELNTVTLSRMPQEDNITEQDAGSVATYGVNELKIENNVIVDDDRTAYITPIFNVLNGIKYYPCDTETVGLGYFQIGDRIKVTDLESNEYEIVIMGITLNLSGGLKERIVSIAPDKGVTNYDYAGIIGKKIRKTEIIVDKQQGQITSIVDDTTEIKQTADAINLKAQTSLDLAEENSEKIFDNTQDISQLQVRADGLDISVTQFGGANLLKNSSGLKGDTSEWVAETGELQPEIIEAFAGATEPDGWIAWSGDDMSGITFNDYLQIQVINGTPSDSRGLYRIEKVNLEEKAISIHIPYTDLSTGYANFELIAMDEGYPNVHSFNLGLNSTTITTGINTGTGWGSITDISVGSYEYLRFRFSDGVVYYEVSEDNDEWVIMTQQSISFNVEETTCQMWVWDDAYEGLARFKDLTLWRDADPDNYAEVLQSTNVQLNSESGSAFVLEDKYIQQTCNTIVGELYTFLCRFKKEGNAKVIINGSELDLETEGYTDDTWEVFKYQFTANNENTTIRVDATETDTSITIADMVLKIGDASGWIQAPNEVYGSNFRFDKEGFSITSTANDFMSQLDNEKLVVYNTAGTSRKSVMVVSKDEGKITDLTAQDTLSLRRYENDEKKVRFIATSTGCMVVVNN